MYFWFPSPTLPEVTLWKHKQNKKLTERLDDYEGYRVMSVYDYKCYQFWKVERSVYIKHVFIWHIQDQLYLSKFSESCMQKQLIIHKLDISEKKFSVSLFIHSLSLKQKVFLFESNYCNTPWDREVRIT